MWTVLISVLLWLSKQAAERLILPACQWLWKKAKALWAKRHKKGGSDGVATPPPDQDEAPEA